MELCKFATMAALAAAFILPAWTPAWGSVDSLPGDSNDDGDVDFADYQTLEANYGTGTAWQQGDFNGDGQVTFADYQILEQHFGRRRLSATIQIQNNTGADKFNWPIFLTVWKVFGGNLPLSELNGQGFHVYDSGGAELPYMLRAIPPDFSLGNDEIVFVVPRINSGVTQTYRITNTELNGPMTQIDVIGNANNLLPNGGFENGASVPTGYTVTANNGATIAFDTGVKRSGTRALRLTMPVEASFTLKTSANISFTAGRHYHFSIWAKSDNVAYNGYGFTNCGSWFKFDTTAFTSFSSRGRTTLMQRGDRDWYCYRFDSASNDAWGIPVQGSMGRTATSTKFNIAGYQQDQPFLHGAKTGTLWVDEALLFEQPAITVDRQTPLAKAAVNGAVTFARPVEMPRSGACVHEAVGRLETYALRGERRQLRFGVHAVSALSNVQVAVSPLTGPGGQIGSSNLELEQFISYSGNDYLGDYQANISLPAGQAQEYFLGIDVPPGTPAGTYTGTVTVNANGSTICTLPVELQVLAADCPSLQGYYLGGIYNVGFPLERNDDFYACYGKARFTLLMLFDYFSTHVNQMGEDFAYAQQQVDKLATLAHVTSGIGLYREPNMSEDQPRMWYQMATGNPVWPGKYVTGTDPAYKTGYQDYAANLESYALAHNWPRMIYMVSDEPDRAADVDASMGWLNERLPNAITVCDAQFADMMKTWQWYNLPSIDDPADWSGPFIYDYMRAHKPAFAICGVATGLECGRYQPGLMMASSGSIYWHWWHTSNDAGTGPFATVNGKVLRQHHVAGMGAGMSDFRYFRLLKDLIDANRVGPKAAIAAAAEAYLNSVFAYANADNDLHLLPYNGTPYRWGHDRWYDQWQGQMKNYIVQLAP